MPGYLYPKFGLYNDLLKKVDKLFHRSYPASGRLAKEQLWEINKAFPVAGRSYGRS